MDSFRRLGWRPRRAYAEAKLKAERGVGFKP